MNNVNILIDSCVNLNFLQNNIKLNYIYICTQEIFEKKYAGIQQVYGKHSFSQMQSVYVAHIIISNDSPLHDHSIDVHMFVLSFEIYIQIVSLNDFVEICL